MISVYVLNNAMDCVSQTSPFRALQLIEEGKASPVKWSERVIRTLSGHLRIPEIIMLFRFIRAYGRKMPFSNRAVWERDDYQCQYCGRQTSTRTDHQRDRPQTDHVFPESRGGKATWDNMVTSCFACNQKKGNKTLAECGMKLLRKPVKPVMSKSFARIAEEVRRIFTEPVQGGE